MNPPPLTRPRTKLYRTGQGLVLLLCGVLPVLASAAPAAAQTEPEPIPPEDDPAPWDIGGQVRRAITDFFHNLVESAINPVLETMGETVLATPDLTSNEQIRTVWTANLVIANTVFVLFIVAAGFVIASRETLQTSYGLKELAPRIVVAGLASNLSLLLVGRMIEFANAVTAGIAGQGVEPATAAQALADIWANAAVGTNFLASLLMIAIVVMAIIVMVTFIIRVAVLCVLLSVAPLALLFHALPQTEQLAFTWWKAVAGCFAIQLGQTVVLVAAVTVFLTPTGPTVLGFPASGSGWLGLLVALAMMWLLVKIPMWVKDYMWLHSRGILRKVIFGLIMLKTMSMAAAGRAAGGRGGRGRPQPGSGRPGPGRPSSPSGPGNGPGPRPSPGGGPGSGPRAGARHRVNPRQPRPSAAQPASSPASPTSPPPGPAPGSSPSAPPSPRQPGPAPGPGRPLQPTPAFEPPRLRRAGAAPAAAPQAQASRETADRAEATSSRAGGTPAADARRPPLRPGAAEPAHSPGSPRTPTDRNPAGRTTRPVPAPAGQPVRYSPTAAAGRPAVSRPTPAGASTPPAAARQPHPVMARSPRGRPSASMRTPPHPPRQQPATPPRTAPSPPPRRRPRTGGNPR